MEILPDNDLMNPLKDRINEFINNSEGFNDDLELNNIDNKHTDHLKKAYDKLNELDELNFRNWSCQSDIILNNQVNINNGLINGILKPKIRQILLKISDIKFFESLKDDINIIKSIGGESLLTENPVDITPGSGSFVEIDGYKTNYRWLRYLYLTKRILDLNLLNSDSIWVDIGPFYGGLQGLIKKYQPKCNIILVDFHHQLLRSFIYLSELYPNTNHILPNQIEVIIKDNKFPKDGCIVYCPIQYVNILDKISEIDLITNFFSFGEMKRAEFTKYKQSEFFNKSKVIYTVNRIVSSPFFNKTFDSDQVVFDYTVDKMKIDYFDIFPIHHFQRTSFNIMGLTRSRNISSPYFELVQRK